MDIPSLLQTRPIIAHTVMPGLKFRQMTGHEGLSQLFEFEVELLADNFNLDLRALLGKPLTLELATTSSPRYLSGQVTRCVMVGRENSVSRHYIYRATVRPWLWYLTQTSDNKIFQQKTVPDIIKEVLGEYGYPFELKLTGSYRSWEYCVQYQETDFAFVSRLMEHEGIYYYFKHERDQHTLVMTDDIASHAPVPGYETIPYFGPDRVTTPKEEYVSMWEVAAQVTPDGYATVDYDFTKPGASLDAMSRRKGGSEPGNLEVFEWQGGFQEAQHGEQYARIRLEELQSTQEQSMGLSNARGLAPGALFTLRNHPRKAENREYLIVSVNYRMSVGGYSTETGLEEFYEASFSALPSNVQYRAPRVTPIPRTHGPQTARVVGPLGKEIWTDKYGRIKVQFHWDRYGQRNESSSCWVRVSSPWAGGGFGGLQLPRINDEVVVDFIGGCPDRPIVLGRVYNANNMPPVELPACATQSGFRSQSVYGDPTMCNMMIFDDTLGAELVHQRAQKDMCHEVNNNHSHVVGCDYSLEVGGNYSIKAKTLKVEIADETNVTLNGPTTVNRKDYSAETVGQVMENTTGNVITSTTGTVTTSQIGAQANTEIGAVGHYLVGAYGSVQIGDFKKTIFGNVG
ncbi:type VI secretion system tip protein VgrG [Bordetella sp. 15P40C-2]|uniref:type VI secretion system Vgr family protein n=1 Tax=Bordetella sp. 15P40C-2 TaxID=2572246 RepID=UPI0013246C08|nr:type VI secretion system tip protein VgrG [Bordetella sp. 15P40C-2]